MRKIDKADSPPACLTEFIKGQQQIEPEPVNLTYEDFRGPARRKLRDLLTREQFGLCGYTGASIDDRISSLKATDDKVGFSNHIEHLKCQKICKEELTARSGVYGRDLGDDLDYYNMIAALEVRGAECELFGAVHKGDDDLPIWPTHEGCETRFRFNDGNGIVEGVDDQAIESIEVLHLNHKTLRGWRESAVDRVLDPEIVKSREDYERLLHAMESPSNGRLPEFAFVIASILRKDLQ